MNTDPTNEERDQIIAIEAESQEEDLEPGAFGRDEQGKYDHDEHFGRKP